MRRVVVTGLAGAGKSTFSKALSAKTGLPAIHLDLHFWKPGWVEPPDAEWREKQRRLLAGEEWIADGNYHATLDFGLSAQTPSCSSTRLGGLAHGAPSFVASAVRRGRSCPTAVRTPPGDGCATNGGLSGGSGVVAARSVNENSQSCRSTGRHAGLHMLRGRQAVREFLDRA